MAMVVGLTSHAALMVQGLEPRSQLASWGCWARGRRWLSELYERELMGSTCGRVRSTDLARCQPQAPPTGPWVGFESCHWYCPS